MTEYNLTGFEKPRFWWSFAKREAWSAAREKALDAEYRRLQAEWVERDRKRHAAMAQRRVPLDLPVELYAKQRACNAETIRAREAEAARSRASTPSTSSDDGVGVMLAVAAASSLLAGAVSTHASVYDSPSPSTYDASPSSSNYDSGSSYSSSSSYDSGSSSSSFD